MKYLLYTIMGYLSGSVLYASLVPRYFHHVDIRKVSDDGNPGTANVFKYVGFGAGCLVICMELLKAFIPVFVAAHRVDVSRLPFAFIMAAPVLGHAFPFLYVMVCLLHSSSRQAQNHFADGLMCRNAGQVCRRGALHNQRRIWADMPGHRGGAPGTHLFLNREHEPGVAGGRCRRHPQEAAPVAAAFQGGQRHLLYR